MKKFFLPSSWGNNTETIKFKRINGNFSGPATENVKVTKTKSKAKSNKQLKNANKKSIDDTVESNIKTKSSLIKIKSGRIEKKKTKVKQNPKQRKLTPSQAVYTIECLEDIGTGKTNENCSLEAKLKVKLLGGRFRFINEQLYTISSKKAESLFHEDPDAFAAYHEGYRHQVDKWPVNPLDRIIKMIRRLPISLVIGDFGCGEGKLAKSIPNKVHSMDLVSCREDIIACNITNTPLPPQSLDVAVYCLSLMGINLNDYLLEANRVLKDGGLVYIAEIQSRFDDLHQFIRFMNSCGFDLIKKEIDKKLFYFLQFKKIGMWEK